MTEAAPNPSGEGEPAVIVIDADEQRADPVRGPGLGPPTANEAGLVVTVGRLDPVLATSARLIRRSSALRDHTFEPLLTGSGEQRRPVGIAGGVLPPSRW